MAQIMLTERDYNQSNLNYICFSLSELFSQTNSVCELSRSGGRVALTVTCPEDYAEIIKKEVCDKAADVIAVNYKYDYFKKLISTTGLNAVEKELLLTSIIAADLDEDKRYVCSKIAGYGSVVLDGVFNFRLKPLKAKWQGIVNCMPEYFQDEQLKDFITYLLEDRKRKVFVEDDKVYDNHYRRLTKGELMDKGMQDGKIIREILLSGCGEVEVNCPLSKIDEHYLKEYFGDKITLGKGYFS